MRSVMGGVVRHVDRRIDGRDGVVQHPAAVTVFRAFRADEPHEVTVLVEFEEAPRTGDVAVLRADVLDVEVAVDLSTFLVGRRVADPHARGVAPRGDGPALFERDAKLLRVARGRRRNEFSHPVGEEHDEESGHEKARGERNGREPRNAQHGEFGVGRPTRHRVDGGEKHGDRHHFIDACRKRKRREDEGVGEPEVLAHVVQLIDQIEEGEERHERQKHKERGRENFTGELLGDDLHQAASLRERRRRHNAPGLAQAGSQLMK